MKKLIVAIITLASMPALAAGTEFNISPLPTGAKVTLQGDSTPVIVDFYGPNIVRIFHDPSADELRVPQANPPANILVENPRLNPGTIICDNEHNRISSDRIELQFDPVNLMLSVRDLATGKTVFETTEPIAINPKSTTIKLKQHPGEFFYGGGVQNGRFSHRGKAIDIVNTNSWTDGGVASPTPYYWSTGGYGVMFHTFAPGNYNFGAKEPETVELTHNTPYLDMFLMVNDSPVTLLGDFYQLTGKPQLLPKFGFYEGHLNAYNRDYWTEAENGILFEDGKRYKESQKDNGGIRETLNGETDGGYQFSARAVIDRYAAHDMPLGWVLPNDGYGAGYGQTSSLDGNIQNLKEFGDYARSKGVEIGLWTQSSLHPKEGVEPLLQRDIVKEVRDAGVRALKTDVAWVGAGYSFGLNGVADVAEIMPEYGNDARPFIISLDGWAGTQRYAGIWTGDQTGGQWEYIRFHIPTYIGSGLSGQPNITSDVDGIFGGKNPVMNTRDFQWKTWTPMQLNMDGWGANPKYPHQFGGEYANIVRAYLKLKSELLPYAYTYARESVDGKPMVRAIFLDYPNDYTHSAATRYQFLYGPDFLVAPIYQATRPDTIGGDVRNTIYLPEGTWYDYFSGRPYVSDGAIVLNNFRTPLWKLPVFVRSGAIIPMANPSNNPSEINNALRIYEIWPKQGLTEATEYDDDGTTQAYLRCESVSTRISADLSAKGVLTVAIDPTKGSFNGFNSQKATELRIPATAVKKVSAKVGKKSVKLHKVASADELTDNTWCLAPVSRVEQYGVTTADELLPMLLVKLAETDVTDAPMTITVTGYEFTPEAGIPAATAITAPATVEPAPEEGDIKPYDLTLRWKPMADASEIQVLHNGMLYTNLSAAEGENSALFEDLAPETTYDFKLRALNAAGASDWIDLSLTTAGNPLEFAIAGIKANCTIADQPGNKIGRAFDLKDGSDIWHTIYSGADLPADITLDLGAFNTLDRLEYLPRIDGGNGTILAGTWQLSENGTDWTDPVSFEWARSGDAKVITFGETTPMRYIRLHVDKAVGRFISAREIFVFRQPGSSFYLPGDINKDGLIDDNDLTSYINYTGLRRGDGDFDYVSIGDVNRNGLIDAFDIANAAVRLNGGIENPAAEIEGELVLTPDRKRYSAGDIVTLALAGKGLKNVNALSLAIPYLPANYEFIGLTLSPAAAKMENLTNDRLHTSGDKVLYPTLVNLGEQPTLSGDVEIATITFRARRAGAFAPAAESMLIVSPALNCK